METPSAVQLRHQSFSDDPRELVQVVRESADYFAEYLAKAPSLRRSRLRAIHALREFGWTIPEIANETGMDADRIREILKLERRALREERNERAAANGEAE